MRAAARWVVLALAALAAPAPARADESARCLVRAILAGHDAGGVDPRISDLAPQLTRAPFSTWKSFRLVSDNMAALVPGQSHTFSLPEARVATLTFKEHLSPANGRHRVRLHLDVKKGNEPLLSTTFRLDEGGTVLNVERPRQGDLLIIGVSCNTGS